MDVESGKKAMEQPSEVNPDSAPSTPIQSKDVASAESPNSQVPPQSSGSSTSSDKDAPNTSQPTKSPLERTQSQASGYSKSRLTIILFSLCMALFLAALDITIITTALPTIASHFHATSADYTWVGSAYLLASAASAPVWGKISDIWGRKPIILLANLVFMIGSLIAALAVTIGMLIGARVIQGIGGGGLVILVYVCIGDLFSMRERPKYYGIMGMTWAIASGVGPVVGGAFTEKVTWRWCFYINLPLDGLSLVLLAVFLKLETPKTPFLNGIKAVDWLGVITIVGGVVMFLFGMESGGVTHPWDSAFTLCLIIFGVVTIALFFLNEWKLAKYPIIPLRIFKQQSNLAALGVCFIHGFVFIGGSYYLPLYFQVVLLASPILSGVYLFAMVITLSAVSAATGIFMKKTGLFREPIIFGLCFMTLGFGLFIAFPDHRVWSKIIIFQIITGIGVGPNFQAPLIALQSHLKGHDIAAGTATFGFVRNLSTALSVVLGGVVFQNQLRSHQARLEQALGDRLGGLLTSSSFGATAAQLKQLPKEQRDVLAQVYTDSLQKMWIFYTAFAAFGIFISLFIKKKELSNKWEKSRTGLEEQERVRKEEKEERDQRKALRSGKGAAKDVEKGLVSGSPVATGSPTGSPGPNKEEEGL